MANISQIERNIKMRLWDFEKMMIERPIIESSLRANGFVKLNSAKDLGITRETLNIKIAQYGIHCPRSYPRKKEIVYSVGNLAKKSDEAMKSMIERYYKENGFIQLATAEKLGISATCLRSYLSKYDIKFEVQKVESISNVWKDEIAKIEKPIIEKYLLKNRGNLVRTSLELGIANGTLHSKIKLYGIQKFSHRRFPDEYVADFALSRESKPLIKELISIAYKKHKTISRTAKYFGIAPTTLSLKMDYYEIKK